MRRHHTPDPRRRAKLPAEPEPPERTGPALSWSEDKENGISTMFIDQNPVATVSFCRGELRSNWDQDLRYMGWIWHAETVEVFGLPRAGGDFDEKDTARLFCEQRFAEVMK